MTASDHLSPVQFSTLHGDSWGGMDDDGTDLDYYTHDDGSNEFDPDGDLREFQRQHPTAAPNSAPEPKPMLTGNRANSYATSSVSMATSMQANRSSYWG